MFSFLIGRNSEHQTKTRSQIEPPEKNHIRNGKFVLDCAKSLQKKMSFELRSVECELSFLGAESAKL